MDGKVCLLKNIVCLVVTPDTQPHQHPPSHWRTFARMKGFHTHLSPAKMCGHIFCHVHRHCTLPFPLLTSQHTLTATHHSPVPASLIMSHGFEDSHHNTHTALSIRSTHTPTHTQSFKYSHHTHTSLNVHITQTPWVLAPVTH